MFLALPVLLLIVFTYIRLFTDPQYLSVFKNTFYYLIGAVLQIAFALFLAYIVSAKYRGADFYKGVIFFPALLNGVAVGMILTVKNAISIFEIPFIITGGENGSSTFVVQTIKTAFDSRKAGMASAMEIVLLVIILVISIIQNKYGVSEEDE